MENEHARNLRNRWQKRPGRTVGQVHDPRGHRVEGQTAVADRDDAVSLLRPNHRLGIYAQWIPRDRDHVRIGSLEGKGARPPYPAGTGRPPRPWGDRRCRRGTRVAHLGCNVAIEMPDMQHRGEGLLCLAFDEPGDADETGARLGVAQRALGRNQRHMGTSEHL